MKYNERINLAVETIGEIFKGTELRIEGPYDSDILIIDENTTNFYFVINGCIKILVYIDGDAFIPTAVFNITEYDETNELEETKDKVINRLKTFQFI